jgi:TP901 family phage tail tape measure protein
MGAGLKQLETAIDLLQKQYAALQGILQAVSRAHTQEKTAVDQQRVATEAAKKAAEEETVALKAKIAALKGNIDEETRYTAEIKKREQAELAAKIGDEDLAGKVMQLRGEQEKLTQAHSRQSGALSSLGMGLNAAGIAYVGIGASILAAAKASIEIEDAMVKVQKTSGLTDTEISALTETFRNMSLRIPESTVALARIGEIAGQLGITGKDNIAKFTETIAKLTTVTDLTVDEAATGMARLSNIYKIPIADIERLGSTLNELENQTTATARYLLDFMERVGGKATLLGVTATQAAGLGAVLNELGTESEVAGTAMSQVFGFMLEKVEIFARQTGLTIEEWRQMVETRPIEALNLWLSKLGELDKFERIQALETMKLDGERAAGVVLKLSENTGMLADRIAIADRAYQENVSLQQEFETRIKSTNQQLQLLWNQVTDLGVSLGNFLLPSINAVVSALRLMIDGLRGVGSWIAQTSQSIADYGGMWEWIKSKIAGVTLAYGEQAQELQEHRRIKADIAEYEKKHAGVIHSTAVAIRDATFQIREQSDSLVFLGQKIKSSSSGQNQQTEAQNKATEAAKLRVAQLKLQIAEEKGNAQAIARARAEVERLTAAHLRETTGSKDLAAQQTRLTSQLDALKESKKRARQETEAANTVARLEIEIRQGFGDLYKSEGDKIEALYIRKKQQIDEFASKDKATTKQILGLRQDLETAYREASEAATAAYLQAINDALESANTKYLALESEKLVQILLNTDLESKAKLKQITDLTTATQKAADDIIAIFGKAKEKRIDIGDEELLALIEQLNQHKSNVALNSEAILEALRSAGTEDIRINQKTIAAIAADTDLSVQARIAKIGEYMAAVTANAEAVKKIEDDLATHNVNLATDEWSKKVQAEYDYYDKHALIIQDLKVSEETKARLFEDLARTTNANILKIDEDYAVSHGGVLDKLGAAWTKLKDDTVTKVDATYKFFSETFTAAANFFKEVFVAAITGDLDRLGKAFADFASRVFRALEDLAAQIVAKKVLEWLKLLWDWIRGTGEEADKTKEKMGDWIPLMGGLGTAIAGLTGAWTLFNFQVERANLLLSQTPSLSRGGGLFGSGGAGAADPGSVLGVIGRVMSWLGGRIGGGMGGALGLGGAIAGGASVFAGQGAMLARAFGGNPRVGTVGALAGGAIGGIVAGIASGLFGGEKEHTSREERVTSWLREALKRNTLEDALMRFGGALHISGPSGRFRRALGSDPEGLPFRDDLLRFIREEIGLAIDNPRARPRRTAGLGDIETLTGFLERGRALTPTGRDAYLVERIVGTLEAIVTRFRGQLESLADLERLLPGTGTGGALQEFFKKFSGLKKAEAQADFNAAITSLDSTLAAFDRIGTLLSEADFLALSARIGQTVESAAALEKGDIDQAREAFEGLSAYVAGVSSFLNEQQAIIDAEVKSDFGLTLDDLRQKFEDNQVVADALGLTHDKLNRAYGIQLMGLAGLRDMQEQIAERTTPEMVLAMNGLLDWGEGVRERVDALWEALNAGLISASEFNAFTAAASNIKDLDLADLEREFVTPFSEFLDDIDAMMGEQVDWLAEYNARLAGIRTEEGLAKLDAADAAIDAINSWFSSLGDFAGIAAEAANRIYQYEVSTVEGIRSKIQELTGAAVTDSASAIDALTALLNQAQAAPLEERAALLEKLSEGLTLSEDLAERQIRAQENAIAKWADEQSRAVSHAENRDALLQAITAQEQAMLEALRLQAEGDTARMIEVWRGLQQAAETSATEADARLHSMMTEVRDAILSERDALLAELSLLNTNLNAVISGYRAPLAEVSAQHGLDYVPADDFRVRAHRGEAVITARGNEALGEILAELRRGNGGGNITVVIQPAPIYLDGKQVSEAVFRILKVEGENGRSIVPDKAVYKR